MKLEGPRPQAKALEIWPDTFPAVEIFSALLTQWRMAPMGGVVGLDYSALPAVFEMMGTPRSTWREVFEDLRVMESEAVETMNKGAK